MDNFEQRIQTAEINLRGSSDPEQRGRALDELRLVVEEARGRTEAKRASELLSQYADPAPQSRDRELAEYERRWHALQGLIDPKLFDLLGELKEKHHIATRLLPVVVKRLRGWIADAILNIADFNEEEVLVLGKFIDVISQIDIYNVELVDLRELRNVIFSLRYVEVARRADDALRVWDDREAWHQLELLEDPPASFAEDVRALQEKIYSVCNVKQKVEALLEQSPQIEPTNWAEVGTLVRYAQETSRSLGGHDIPASWKEQLQRRMAGALNAALQFLVKRAAAAGTFKDVHDFQAEYETLQLTEIHDRLRPQAQWFQNFLKQSGDRVSREVLKATGRHVLDEIAGRLRKEKADLPGCVREKVESTLQDIGLVSAAWASMRAGAEFSVPAPTPFMLPEAFEGDAAIFGERLNRVKAASARLNAEGSSSEQTCLEALDVARLVLAEQPGHLLAAELKEEAEQKLASLRVENALAVWDFEQLLALCRDQPGKWAFSYYVKHEADLRLWLEPSVKKEKFTSWEDAQTWWVDWQKAVAQIPKQLPDSLIRAMRREEEKRRDEWAEVLGELIDRDLPPEECENIADSLKDWPEDFNLQGFRQSFQRKAEVGRAYRFIKSREWDAAQRIIDSLDEIHPDPRTLSRLKIHLEVERARQQGVEALAEVLKRQWGTVKSYYNDAFALLLKAIEDAWTQQRGDAVVSLREVAWRVLAREQGPDPQLEQIRKWEDWFTVEQAIKSEESATSLRQLIAYIKNGQPEKVLRSRLDSLVKYWRDQENQVMLALADQMFDWLSLIPNPGEVLKTNSDKVADRVLHTLKSQEEPEIQQLQELHQELNLFNASWRTLTEYLNLVNESFSLASRRVLRLRPSETFERARLLVGNLINVRTALAELAEADLRQPVNKERLETITAILLRDLPDVRARTKLRAQAARLEPLSRLNAIENNIRNEALRCRSDKDVDFYEPGAFASLAGKLRELVERFNRAGLQQGPMWRILSVEYVKKVYALACIYAPPPPYQDLELLAQQIDELEATEREFRDGLEKVWETKPSLGAGSTFNPEEHEDFLRSFPHVPPRSRRDYLFFEYRFAEAEPLKSIIFQSYHKLPGWIRIYLDEGIPACADET